MDELSNEIELLCRRAHCASMELALTDEQTRNSALMLMSRSLIEHADEILSANALDREKAQAEGVRESLIDRLLLTPERLEEISKALCELVELPDPIGVVHEERVLYNGLILKRISVPLGVVGIIYEARPNVTADAAGICLKSGNAVILRGGSLAAHTNEVMGAVLAEAAVEAGLPEGSIQSITSTERTASDLLMQMHGLVDVIIPRGGKGLIEHCVETSKVPVIETGTGNCHVYVHRSADLEQARDIIVNAKCRRYGVCNAAETLLVDEEVAEELLMSVVPELSCRGVELHLDERAYDIVSSLAATGLLDEDAVFDHAQEQDWETEYLGPEIAIRCVEGLQDAISHINQYGTRHSESIVAQDKDAIERFQCGVDAAVVYANASTAFTDGGQFGLGAEIGISTQKLHVRGPFALDALTSYKYLIVGEGQTRA